MIQLSVEFDNFHTVRGWYNLTDCKAVYIDVYDGRLGVAIDLGKEGIYWIMVNESKEPYTNNLNHMQALNDILYALTSCLPHYGSDDLSERHRYITH